MGEKLVYCDICGEDITNKAKCHSYKKDNPNRFLCVECDKKEYKKSS